MSTSSSRQRFALFVLFLVTLGWVYLLNDSQPSPLLAAESPLVQPWPTLVVHYPPHLDGVAAAPNGHPALQNQMVEVSFLFHSPLPRPTRLPDALLPTTVLTVTGELGNEGWLRSPATLTFAINDNLGAAPKGLPSEYRLAGAADWTEREYYYPSPNPSHFHRAQLYIESLAPLWYTFAAQAISTVARGWPLHQQNGSNE